ncbi:MAG TPA: transcriptional repressor [Chloroflexi bacterium]|nr:transcriptional repressor [Chloroflexota bacterium]
MQALETALRKLRDAGYKITEARRAVLNVLQESGGHLTSSQILARVGAYDPSIGRASVFRTLDLLTSLSIIRPTYFNSRTPSYVLMTQEGHHAHIVCTHCHATIELDDCHVGQLVQELEARYNIRLAGHLLEFYGLCPSCAAGKDTS